MFAGMGAGRHLDGCRGSSEAGFLNCQTAWQMPDVALSRRKQGFASLGSANEIKHFRNKASLRLASSSNIGQR
jgi:hypothetical protein